MTTTDTAPLSAEDIASRLTEIADLHSRTTQGTWKREGYVIFVEEGRGHEVARATPRSMHVFADADFLARAHKDVPWLVATCRDLSARVKELETFQSDAYDTLLAIGLALGLPDPTAPDAPEQAPAAWHGKLSEKVAAVVARATQAEAERDALREAAYTAMGKLNSAIYRANFIEKWHADPNCDVQTRATEAKAFAQAAKDTLVKAVAALSPAQPAQGADPLDMPLPCDVNLPNMRFGKGVSLRTLVDAAARWKVIAARVPLAEMEPALEAARSAGLLTTETTEGGNG